MAERDELLRTLPPEVREDADEMYSSFEGPDPHEVVAELHRKGLLTTGQLREAVLTLEAELKIRRLNLRPPEDRNPTIIGPLGEGAMGEVLLAKDEGLNRVVAMKKLLPGRAGKGMLRRFYIEAQITAQLDHPSIVPIYGLLQAEDGGLAYAMKLVRGETLEDYVEACLKQERAGEVDEHHSLNKRIELFLNVCEALAYAHNRGVLHRDLKPENIMVGAFGQVMVMDWGIAKLLEGSNVQLVDPDTGDSKKANATKLGQVIGTPRYMSPEQAFGRNDVLGPASDQYALGLILYELVSLRGPCPLNVSLPEALDRAQNARKDPLKHAAGHKIPKELAAIIDKATQKEPAQRYASVTELAEDLRRWRRDEAVLARPDSIMQRMGRFISRHRTGVLVLISGLFAVLVVSVSTLMVASVGGLEVYRWRAEAHEARISAALSEAVEQGRVIDGELRHYEALITGLSFAAERALSPVGEEVLPEGYDPQEPPPRRRASKVYGAEVAVDRPSIQIISGSSLGDPTVSQQVTQLIILGPELGRVLVDSPSRPATKMDRKARFKRVDGGVPIRWARVATQAGVIATVPGIEGLKTGARDVRQDPWYSAPKGTRGPAWSPPIKERGGDRLLLTVSHPLFDGKGKFSGVVSADVLLDELIDRLEPPKGGEAWLVNEEGRVTASEPLRGGDTYKATPFEHKAVWAAIQEGAADGWLEHDGHLWVWSHVASTGWVYIVRRGD